MLEECDDDSDHECDKIINDDMTFVKPKINEKYVELQKLVVEFVTSLVLKHETEFYELVDKRLKGRFDILATTSKTIIQMITETTNKYYNDLYLSIQNNTENPSKKLITEMTDCVEYGSNVLLDKLIHFTLDTHIDVTRENLLVKNVDLYTKSVLAEINLFLQSTNIIKRMAKDEGDDVPFVNVPPAEKPFNIVIDKNIEN